jgi:hypothetical protein
MLKANGGNKVGTGTYWNFRNGERVDISTEGVLPGSANTVYFRMPAIGILLLGPILGLIYAAFLPFIGIAMLLKLLVQKIGGTFFESVRTSGSFGWRPSESYLAGKKRTEAKTEKDEGGGGTS